MHALVLTPANKTVQLRNLPVPIPGPNELLVKVHAVALNPVDEHYVFHPIAEQEERIIGTDFAGIVVDVGEELKTSEDPRAKTGARVAGFLQGACSSNDRPGAFTEYLTIAADLVWSVPAHLTLESAATVSMCGLTAAQGVFTRLGLPCSFASVPGFPALPESNGQPVNVLVYGASTSLALYAAQLIRYSFPTAGRVRLIGVAGVSNHDFLCSAPYSYDVLIDYKAADWTNQVAKATGGRGVDFAMDCISEGKTVSKTESTLAEHGRLAVFRGPKGGQYDPSTLRIKPIYGAVWEGLGVEIGYNGAAIAANPVARAFATKFYDFLGTDVLVPNPVRLMPGGLDCIPKDGLLLFAGNEGGRGRTEKHMRPISAEKLVYSIVS